jgi:hypothetical protein
LEIQENKGIQETEGKWENLGKLEKNEKNGKNKKNRGKMRKPRKCREKRFSRLSHFSQIALAKRVGDPSEVGCHFSIFWGTVFKVFTSFNDMLEIIIDLRMLLTCLLFDAKLMATKAKMASFYTS